MYETLGIDLDKGYQPIVKSSTGENKGVLGQVTYTFKINGTPFTQSFIVCRHMTRHMILGTDFTAMNFMGVIWTREGTQKLMHSNGQTIMELPDSITEVLLVLAYSVKIEPRSQRTVPLECTKSMSKWASPIVVVPKSQLPGNPQREDYVLISGKSMH